MAAALARSSAGDAAARRSPPSRRTRCRRPTASAGPAPSGTPSRQQPPRLQRAAPTITGRPACQDSVWASSRANPRARAAVSVAPLRDTPGISARPGRYRAPARRVVRRRPGAALRVHGHRPSTAAPARLSARSTVRPSPGTQVGQRHGQRTRDQPRRDRARPAESLLDRALQRVARQGGRSPAIARSRRAAAGSSARADSISSARMSSASAAAAPCVQRDLECLAQLGVQLGVGPAGEPRDQGRVGRGGDRQQLGRALQRAQRDRFASREPPRSPSAALEGATRRGPPEKRHSPSARVGDGRIGAPVRGAPSPRRTIA